MNTTEEKDCAESPLRSKRTFPHRHTTKHSKVFFLLLFIFIKEKEEKGRKDD